MTKIVINTCYGGFGLSEKAESHLSAVYNIDVHYRDLERDNPALIATVEELGEAANGRSAKLKVVEIPDGVTWQIDEYDGVEWVAEIYRTWR